MVRMIRYCVVSHCNVPGMYILRKSTGSGNNIYPMVSLSFVEM